MLNIKLEGYVEAKRVIDQLPNKMQKTVILSALRSAATPMLRSARSKVPKRTGNLAKKLKVVRVRRPARKSETAIHIKHAFQRTKTGEVTNEFYGHMIHEGTKERRPKKKKVLAFKAPDGKMVFTCRAAPIKKNPYLEYAYRETKQMVITRFGGELVKATEKFMNRKFKQL